jgi:hypothetical protein
MAFDFPASIARKLLLAGLLAVPVCSCQEPDRAPSPLLEQPGVRAMISQADELDEDCRSQMDSQTSEKCEARDALYERIRGKGICWGPHLTFWYRKSWIPCDRMNDILVMHSGGNAD